MLSQAGHGHKPCRTALSDFGRGRSARPHLPPPAGGATAQCIATGCCASAEKRAI